jgi:hypothetical protein
MKNKTVEEQAKEFVENNKFKSDFPADYMSFIFGFRAKQKETDKIILDTLNKYRSALSNEEKVKLTKVISKEKIDLLKAKINVLLELQNKLK